MRGGALLLLLLSFSTAQEAAEVDADGNAAPAAWLNVHLTFNNEEKATISVRHDEDAIAAALRYVYDVRAKPARVFLLALFLDGRRAAAKILRLV